MAKKNKFYLKYSGKLLRTIEELQKELQTNFCTEDVLDLYNKKILHKWLEVGGYTSVLEAVSAIASKDPNGIIDELCCIFSIEEIIEDEEIIESLVDLEMKKAENAFDDYLFEYYRLRNGIIETPYNAAVVEESISKIISYYPAILNMDYMNILLFLIEHKCAMTIVRLLMNDSFRYFLDTFIYYDYQKKYRIMVLQWIGHPLFIEYLGENLTTFVCNRTAGQWMTLKPQGKKCMIIGMDEGVYVRSAGYDVREYSRKNTFEKFIVVDGIEYRCDSEKGQLRYVEA